jgi:hypothetical protein
MNEHLVRGLPMLILFNSDGAEAQRFTKLVEPAELIEAFEQVK